MTGWIVTLLEWQEYNFLQKNYIPAIQVTHLRIKTVIVFYHYTRFLMF